MKKIGIFVLILCMVMAGIVISGCTDDGKEAPPDFPEDSTINVVNVTIADVLADPLAYDSIRISGSVIQSFDASGYTFMEINDGTESMWVAGYAASIANGSNVTASGSLMLNFPSLTLNRTFSEILFADTVLTDNMTLLNSPHGTINNTDTGSVIKVTPVEGGITIGEIKSDAAALSGKEIKVAAVVTKIVVLIDENFLTLEDGTGTLKARAPDKFNVNAGDEVVITGTVATDVDLGSGYYYNVLLLVTDVK